MNIAELDPRALHFHVEDLLYEYAEVLDDGALEGWPELFIEQGSYEIVARENVERGLRLALMRCESKAMMQDRVTALREANFYSPRFLRHAISNTRARLAPDGAVLAQSNFVVLQTLVDDETRLLSTGRYLDRIVVDGDRLRFAAKRCIYDSTLIPNTITYPL